MAETLSRFESVKLYHYWRSSSSWRVRWALHLKKQDVEMIPVSLLDGESESPEHLKRHPLGYVPVLQVGDKYLIESVAIVEWLEQHLPSPWLYPQNTFDKAYVRALVEVINADTQPIQNLSVMDKYSSDETKRKEWSQYFIRRGLSAYQTLCQPKAGKFSFGDHVTAADLFLVPQCYNALRFDVSLDEFPVLKRIYDSALATPECQASHPDRYQPKK